MRVAVVAYLLPGLVFAQGFAGLFEKAPPQVENDLKERIEFFFQSHKDKKFRQADQAVHEESKDAFFAADKLTFREFKLVSIAYEENFTRARAVVEIDAEIVAPGFGAMKTHRPIATFWKVDSGKWWWYIPKLDNETAFGTMKPGPELPAGVKPMTAPALFEQNQMTPEKLRASVKVDRTEVLLKSHEPSEESITFTNNFIGDVHLKIQSDDLPDLTVKAEKEVLKTGESGKVFFISKAKGNAKKPDGRAWITVEEIAKTVQVQVNFAYPPGSK